MPTDINRNMTKYTHILALLLIGILWRYESHTNTEEAKEENVPPAGPDIGGLEMPRGLITKTSEATPGYVYFSPLLSGTTYLINMDGQVVHTWESEYGPSGWVYLKENGNLVRGGVQPDAPIYGGGGQGGRLQEFTWDGDLVWDYRYATEEYRAHHDVAIMSNGNILVIAWETKTPEEAIQAGRNPENTPRAGLWPDKVVELKPSGNSDATIVWEWHIWDHLIQDFDESKDNYGIPSEHPELLDINIGGHLPPPTTEEELDEARNRNNAVTNTTPDNRGADMYHMNAINYNRTLDQIVLSTPGIDEIMIIDHSTTTQEAASHSGGRWNKGGDLLYRWGNPQNYNRGDSTNQTLSGQHDVKWVPSNLPGGGNIMVFDNVVPNNRPPYSAVLEIAPPLLEDGYAIADGKPYGPEEANRKYIAEDTVSMFAPFISGAHRMASGNTFVTVGPKGRYMELAPSGKVIWDYWTPYSGDARMPDGTFPQPVGPLIYATFRATHISIDHPAVAGKSLLPLDPQPAIKE